METITQQQILLNLLRQKTYVTNMDIMRECGVCSPTKLISNMRKAGYDIKDFWTVGKNRFGREVRYKGYYYHG